MLVVNRTFISPNRSAGWSYGRPTKVVIHSTRSGVIGRTDHNLEMQSTINWFMGTNSSASSNLVISPTEIVRMVADEFPSWHAKEHSWQAWGIELTQPMRDTPYEEGHYVNLVRALKHYQTLGPVELVHLSSLAWGDATSGLIGHEETAQGLRDGKSDPGPQFNWAKLLAMLNDTQEDDVVTTADFEKIRKIVKEEVRAGAIYVKCPTHPSVYRLTEDQTLVGVVNPDVFGLEGDFSDVTVLPADSSVWNLEVTYPSGIPTELRK